MSDDGLTAPMTPRPEHQNVPLTKWDWAAFVVLGLAAVAIGAGGFYLSYGGVSAAMRPHFGANARYVPIFIDADVFVFSGLDVVLARLESGHPLVRLVPLLGTVATIWLNVSIGGGVAAEIAHAAMPSVWVAFTEVARHVVRQRMGLATGSTREGIPFARWVADPTRSLLLWRRMRLWDIRSYDEALEREYNRLEVISVLRDSYGLKWRWKVSSYTKMRLLNGKLTAADILTTEAKVSTTRFVASQESTSPAQAPSAVARPSAAKFGGIREGVPASTVGKLVPIPEPPVAVAHAAIAPKPTAVTAVVPSPPAEPTIQVPVPDSRRDPGAASPEPTISLPTETMADGTQPIRLAYQRAGIDRQDAARTVYLAYMQAERSLTGERLANLSGYSPRQGARLLTTLRGEFGSYEINDTTEDDVFSKDLIDQITAGYRLTTTADRVAVLAR